MEELNFGVLKIIVSLLKYFLLSFKQQWGGGRVKVKSIWRTSGLSDVASWLLNFSIRKFISIVIIERLTSSQIGFPLDSFIKNCFYFCLKLFIQPRLIQFSWNLWSACCNMCKKLTSNLLTLWSFQWVERTNQFIGTLYTWRWQKEKNSSSFYSSHGIFEIMLQITSHTSKLMSKFYERK